MKYKKRRAGAVIALLFREVIFVRMTEIEKLQSALEKLIDLFLANLVRGEEVAKVEIRESAIGHAGRQKLPQAAGINRTEFADFFEDHTLQRVLENAGVEEPADLDARPALDQHRAEKPQRGFLQFKSAV